VPNINIRKWPGSLASSLAPEDQVPGDFVTLENFIYDSDGLPVVRGGRRALCTGQLGDGEVIDGLHVYNSGWLGQEGRNFLVIYCNGSVFESPTPYDYDDIRRIKQYTTLTRKPSFCTFRGWLIMATGSDHDPYMYYWDGQHPSGSGDYMTRIGKGPNAYIVAGHAGRLWAADMEGNSRVYYSAPFDPLAWDSATGGGWIEVGPGDGNIISALVPGFAGEMIIFKDGPAGGATYRLSGLSEPTFSVSPLSTTIGAMHHRLATQVGDGDIFFGSRRGIHSFRRVVKYGDLESAFIDHEISEKWRSLPNNVKRNAFAADDFHHDTWWLFVDKDLDGTNDEGWLFNYRRASPRGNPSISTVTFGAGSAVTWEDPRKKRDTFVTGGTDGRVYSEHNPEAQDTISTSVDYSWTASMAPIDGGDEFAVKAWKKLWLNHDNWGEAEFTVEWFGDNRSPSSSTVSLNPADFPTPHYGVRDGVVRGAPDIFAVNSFIALQSGGKRINVSFSGDRGRLKLRGARFWMDVGRPHSMSDRFLTHSKTRTR
jgi:hypothetical protein